MTEATNRQSKIKEVLVHGLVYGQFTQREWERFSHETQHLVRENAITQAERRSA